MFADSPIISDVSGSADNNDDCAIITHILYIRWDPPIRSMMGGLSLYYEICCRLSRTSSDMALLKVKVYNRTLDAHSDPFVSTDVERVHRLPIRRSALFGQFAHPSSLTSTLYVQSSTATDYSRIAHRYSTIAHISKAYDHLYYCTNNKLTPLARATAIALIDRLIQRSK